VLHVRVVCPTGDGGRLAGTLLENPAVHNVIVLPRAAQRPTGDLVQFDLARESANEILALLREHRLEHIGSIAIERIDMAFSDVAAAAERAAPGDPSEAVIWEEVEARVRDESGLSASFVLMLTIAVAIAAVGILTDSPVLIVGAMVVGPEYGPLASIAMGLHKGRTPRVWRGLRALAGGFPVSVVAAWLLTLAIDVTGRTPDAYLAGTRPLTQFISRPDLFSVIVAVLAGVAGTLALTEARAGTLIGVLVSVTTVPAAANIGVALAHGRSTEAGGALGQLALNLVAITLVGAMTLRVQWWLIQRRSRRPRSERPSPIS
jgi:uncharacterized hydrophobic protein (TIGR00271 family)